jgi:hypothetical protein
MVAWLDGYKMNSHGINLNRFWEFGAGRYSRIAPRTQLGILGNLFASILKVWSWAISPRCSPDTVGNRYGIGSGGDVLEIKFIEVPDAAEGALECARKYRGWTTLHGGGRTRRVSANTGGD